MRVGKYKTPPPISHEVNTSVERDHIRPIIIVVTDVVKACGLC